MPALSTLNPPLSYKSVTVYILDDVAPKKSKPTAGSADDSDEDMEFDQHKVNCAKVRWFFEIYTDYKVKGVILPQESEPNDFYEYWEKELKRKGSEDLFVIYYHGRAGKLRSKHCFLFDGEPGDPVDAFKFIGLINKAGVASLMLLDCDFPSRIHTKFEKDSSNIEIIARGGETKDPWGNTPGSARSFTESFIKTLRGLCKQIDDKFKKYTKPRSVPGFLSLDKAIDFNPTIIRLNRSGYEGIIVERIKIDPEEVRRSRKIEFFSFVLQDDTLDSSEHGEESSTAEEAVLLDEGLDAGVIDEGIDLPNDDESQALFCLQ